jgi:hypothetical protein
MLTNENAIFVDDFMITCPKEEEEQVRLLVDQAYQGPGNPTRNALFALEDAGYVVELEGAFCVVPAAT